MLRGRLLCGLVLREPPPLDESTGSPRDLNRWRRLELRSHATLSRASRDLIRNWGETLPELSKAMSELAARPIRALLIPLIVLTEGRLVPQVILDEDLLLARRPPARHQYSLPAVSPMKLSKAARPKVDGEAVSHSEGVEAMVEAG